jgi:hypothetical protein
MSADDPNCSVPTQSFSPLNYVSILGGKARATSTGFAVLVAARGPPQPRQLSGSGQAMDRAGAGCSSAVLRGVSGRDLALAAVEVESTAQNGLHAAWACGGPAREHWGDRQLWYHDHQRAGRRLGPPTSAAWPPQPLRRPARPDVQSLWAGTKLPVRAQAQLGRLGPVLAAHGGCARRARAAIAGCSAG